MSNHWHKTPISLLLPRILAKFPENSFDFQVLPEGYAKPKMNPNKQELLSSFLNMHQSPIHISSDSATLSLSESIENKISLLHSGCFTRSKRSVLNLELFEERNQQSDVLRTTYSFCNESLTIVKGLFSFSTFSVLQLIVAFFRYV